jgi:eukaryotic translation initiation factor 2C
VLYHGRILSLTCLQPGCSLFSLRPALLQVDGGRLPNPQPIYQSNKPKPLKNGRWKFINEKFYKRIANKSFNALLLRGPNVYDNAAVTIFDNLVHWTGTAYGVARVNRAAQVPLNSLGHQTINDSIQTQLDNRISANMAVLVLGKKEIAGYSAFKDLCDRNFGLHALCITTAAMRRQDGDRWGNITLKMNLKAAGINSTVAGGLISRGFMEDTLVLGGCPSIAAMVGSVDAHAGRFLGSMRLQRESRKEVGAYLVIYRAKLTCTDH